MRRHLRVLGIALLVALTTASCSSGQGRSAPSSSPGRTEPTPTGGLATSGCPVSDHAFCETAVEVATALSAGKGGQLLLLSRPTRIECAQVARRYFPGCKSRAVLNGYGISDASLLVDVIGRHAYGARLEAVLAKVDASYSDELGEGSPKVLGVGSCGPDVPGRRTYHLAWTAALSERADPPGRVLGSLEFTLQDHEWRIALWYMDMLDRWEVEQADPLAESFCEAGRHPWRS